MVMALALGFIEGQRCIGMASFDAAKHEIGVNQFADDEGYRNLECLFLQLGIQKCLLPKAPPVFELLKSFFRERDLNRKE